MLGATVTYNVSIILLAVAAKSESTKQDRRSLTTHVAGRGAGSLSIGLGVAGWVLELMALTRISVTLARVIYAAGFGVLLLLARWWLGEVIQRRQATGIILIAAGIVAVAATSPHASRTTPGLLGWVILTLVMIPVIFVPDMTRRFTNSSPAYLSAIGAGLGYAASNLYTKGVADELSFNSLLPFALLGIAAGITSLIAFADQIVALQTGRATTVVPIVSGLQAVIPITIASLFFGEKWPTTLGGQFLLGGGIAFAIAGMIVLAYSSAQFVHGAAAPRGQSVAEPTTK
jgi:drug/metabolite transporter (DMT)-like permease